MEYDMDNDKYIRLIHRMEQATESLKLLASPAWAYYNAMMEQGFSKEQAHDLTRDFMAITLEASYGNGPMEDDD